MHKPLKPTETDAAESAPTILEFEGFYRAHFDFVWRTLRRLGVPDPALDDATQEVFLVVYRRFSDFRPGTSAKAWLFAIAQHVARDQRRSARRKGSKLVPLSEHMSSTAHSPLEHAMQRQASDVVLEFLGKIDEDRRAAFILSDLEQMAAPEIARIVHANVNTVYYRIASARRAFAEFVAKRHGKAPEEGA